MQALTTLFARAQLASRHGPSAVAARRMRLLDPCLPLFTDRMLRPAALDYPRLAGTSGGLRWDIQLVPDGLGYRKLPALWMLVSLPEALPVTATLHLMLRPTGNEGFSNFTSLPLQTDPPAGFPADMALRTDDSALMPPPALMLPFLSRLDPDRLKEIIISPKGLRVTVLLEQAERGKYLLFRQTDLGRAPADPADLREVMEAMADLRAAVLAEGGNERLSA